MRGSVFGGVAAARRLVSVSLLHTVHAAFVHGMDVMLWLCTAIAVAGMVLSLIFLAGRTAAPTATKARPAPSQDEVAVGGVKT